MIRQLIRSSLPLTALLATSACIPPAKPPVEEPPMPFPKQCDATGLDDLIGKQQSAETGQEALRRSGSRTLRWIAPGQAVTMDYRTDRLNLHVDAQGIITEIRCG